MSDNKSTGTWIWVLVVSLVVLHQDNWFWESETLVLGFIPIGLFYHACISMAAATTWFLGTKYAWPQDVEVAADFSDASERAGASE